MPAMLLADEGATTAAFVVSLKQSSTPQVQSPLQQLDSMVQGHRKCNADDGSHKQLCTKARTWPGRRLPPEIRHAILSHASMHLALAQISLILSPYARSI